MTHKELTAKINRTRALRDTLWMLFALILAQSVNARSLPGFTDLIEEASPAVVKINTVSKGHKSSQMQIPQNQAIPRLFRDLLEPRRSPERHSRSMGSGFIISTDGYILTNNHVIEGADEIMVRLTDRREFDATVIGRDQRSDLALLKIDADSLPVLELAKPDNLKVGEWVLAIGSPFGLDFSASAGIVSAIGRSIPTERNENYVPFIQTDVAINPGNSGGPLFNLKGEVVGINSQIYTRSGGSIGLSFAIPTSVAKEVVEQLKAKGRVDRGWLGVAIQDVSRDLADSFGLKKPAGALVSQVMPRGPADSSGIKAGDVIVKFAGIPIETSGDLPHAVGRTAPGKSVPVKVVREGKEKTIQVEVGTLGAANDEAGIVSQSPADVTGRLGLIVGELDERQKQAWHISSGVLVKQVQEDGSGAAAGLRPGDVIAQLGFNDIDSLETYEKVETLLPANSLIPVRFFRRGRPAYRTIMIKE